MPYLNDNVDDFTKLQRALSELVTKVASIDGLLEAAGLSHMPMAQRYGILFGLMVFFCTITAVIVLLVWGGSFARIAEQSKTGEPTLTTATEARAKRALLLERLLEGRQRMLQKNYPHKEKEERISGMTNLTKMLLTVAPSQVSTDQNDNNNDNNNNNNNNYKNDEQQKDFKDQKKAKDQKKTTSGTKKTVQRYIPEYYEENYKAAYRSCQDRPGGPILSGRPEARFEAYARAYAGCGAYTSLAYRRSYGRMYEALCCQSLKTDDYYTALYQRRPYDIIGKYVRLEALEIKRHLDDVFHLTSGEPTADNKAFDPQEVWGFQPEGPFETAEDLRDSFVFQHRVNEAAFALVHAITEKTMGVIKLTNDDPNNLSIQLEPPLIQPVQQGSPEQLEACFLLIDRLIAYGYRRIQISIDAQDVNQRKLASRLGFTMEGILYKHCIVKDASRDSHIFGLLNHDWEKNGARAALFGKLYGQAAQRFDRANERYEQEQDQQKQYLSQQKTDTIDNTEQEKQRLATAASKLLQSQK